MGAGTLGIKDRGSAGDGRHRRPPAMLLAVACVAALALALFPGSAEAVIPYPPVAGSAVKTAEGFELHGTVYPYGTDTTYHFEYGTTTAYGQSVPVPDADAGTATIVAVSQMITGLEANTTYHYRLVSTNSAEGTPLFSADRTFSTAETTTPPVTPGGGGSSPAPAPPGPKAPTPTPGGKGGAGAAEGGGAGAGAGATGTGGGEESTTVVGKGPKTVAKALRSKGGSVLATRSGRTLYTLSVEHKGKFVCTMSSGCLSAWHPLIVAAGVVPQGPVALGTVKRPEGDLQVTFRGRPLYTFGGDTKAGQAKGEGLKDVGVWHAAVIPTKR
jgi:predicted lipoprotein with Yx(FWY)xxD motif